MFEVEVNGKLEIGVPAVFFPAKKKPSPLSANSVRVSGRKLPRERRHLERKTVGSPGHPVQLVLLGRGHADASQNDRGVCSSGLLSWSSSHPWDYC